jgi:Tfp pilus assembly protein PilV
VRWTAREVAPMFRARSFVRPHLRRLFAALCVVSALAFVLGQGVAALQARIARDAAQGAPQITEQVTGAHGTTPTPAPPASQAAPSRLDAITTHSDHSTAHTGIASPARPLTADKGSKGKGKQHRPKQLKAAGKSLHGGLPHGDSSGAKSQKSQKSRKSRKSQNEQSTQDANSGTGNQSP